MSLDSVPGLVIALLFVLPGVVYQTTRTRLQGPHAEEQDNTSRLMRALTASTVLIGLHTVAAGPALLNLARGPMLTRTPDSGQTVVRSLWSDSPC